MFTNKVNAALFGWERKMVVLIKSVKLTQKFEEVLERRALLKVGQSRPVKCELIVLKPKKMVLQVMLFIFYLKSL